MTGPEREEGGGRGRRDPLFADEATEVVSRRCLGSGPRTSHGPLTGTGGCGVGSRPRPRGPPKPSHPCRRRWGRRSLGYRGRTRSSSVTHNWSLRVHCKGSGIHTEGLKGPCDLGPPESLSNVYRVNETTSPYKATPPSYSFGSAPNPTPSGRTTLGVPLTLRLGYSHRVLQPPVTSDSSVLRRSCADSNEQDNSPSAFCATSLVGVGV